jgi:hypothetical protein
MSSPTTGMTQPMPISGTGTASLIFTAVQPQQSPKLIMQAPPTRTGTRSGNSNSTIVLPTMSFTQLEARVS